MNDQLRQYLDIFCSAYLDDILIWGNQQQEHETNVRQILQCLRDAGLYLNAGKCEFSVTETRYLGYIVSPEGIKMDPRKVEAMIN